MFFLGKAPRSIARIARVVMKVGGFARADLEERLQFHIFILHILYVDSIKSSVHSFFSLAGKAFDDELTHAEFLKMAHRAFPDDKSLGGPTNENKT